MPLCVHLGGKSTPVKETLGNITLVKYVSKQKVCFYNNVPTYLNQTKKLLLKLNIFGV